MYTVYNLQRIVLFPKIKRREAAHFIKKLYLLIEKLNLQYF